MVGLDYVAKAFSLGYTQAQTAAEFTKDGALKLPENYREWVFLGATNPDFRHTQD